MEHRIFRLGRSGVRESFSIIIKLSKFDLNANVCCSHSRLFLFVEMNVLSNSFTKIERTKNTAKMKNDQPLIKFHLLVSRPLVQKKDKLEFKFRRETIF